VVEYFNLSVELAVGLAQKIACISHELMLNFHLNVIALITISQSECHQVTRIDIKESMRVHIRMNEGRHGRQTKIQQHFNKSPDRNLDRIRW